ncbi:MAG: gliding motility-associated C-terminal domain-containing protein [Bacteroidetes bacterium]|nr:gliding motility-associated C-terminal domain-containing protein [Bacteroidota bacterium]
MKNVFFFISILLLLASCKKEEPFNPDEHITYEHWYKLNRSSDTLYSVYLANAFTPNGDGINDAFKPIGNYTLGRFVVYNKYGEEIYKTTDPNKMWNGKVNGAGHIVQMGTYTFQLFVSDLNGENYEYTGSVILYK